MTLLNLTTVVRVVLLISNQSNKGLFPLSVIKKLLHPGTGLQVSNREMKGEHAQIRWNG